MGIIFDFLKPKMNEIETQYIKHILDKGAKTSMDKVGFLEKEIAKFKSSPAYRDICVATRYYNGEQDILTAKREAIGKDGKIVELLNLPNNKIIDNQYAIAVDKKVNYLVGKPITITSDKDNYLKLYKSYFNNKFFRTFQSMTMDSVSCAIGYLHPYYDLQGQLKWKHFRTWEILPFWKDEEHTELDSFGRMYTIQGYEGTSEVVYEKFDYYDETGIKHFVLEGNTLIPDVEHPDEPYFQIVETAIEQSEKSYVGRWNRIPLIAFKRSPTEHPLICRCKSLQDGINQIVSTFMNNIEEDTHNTIIILKNYDGENLGEFRQNLAQYGAVKVTTVDGVQGGVETLKVEVNTENFKAILGVLKEALIENTRSFTVRDSRLTTDANQMHIQSMFADADMDADFMETEFQAALEDVKYFIDTDLSIRGKGDFFDEEVKITFNRNMLIDENTKIQNLIMSESLLSKQTLLAKHPYVENPLKEMEQIKKEAKENDLYSPLSDNESAEDVVSQPPLGGVNNE